MVRAAVGLSRHPAPRILIQCEILSDHDLGDRHEILQRTAGQAELGEDEEPSADTDTELDEGTGGKVRLCPWNKRIRKNMGC